MGDKSPKSKQKNQTQKQSRDDASAKAKMAAIASKQQAGINKAGKKR